MENIYTEEYLEKRHTRFLKSKDDSVAAAQHKTFLEGLNTRLRLGEVIGFSNYGAPDRLNSLILECLVELLCGRLTAATLAGSGEMG